MPQGEAIGTPEGFLRHVIGYTWDGGASGIEKVFNDDLISENPGLVTALKDAAGNEVQRFYKKGRVKLQRYKAHNRLQYPARCGKRA